MESIDDVLRHPFTARISQRRRLVGFRGDLFRDWVFGNRGAGDGGGGREEQESNGSGAAGGRGGQIQQVRETGDVVFFERTQAGGEVDGPCRVDDEGGGVPKMGICFCREAESWVGEGTGEADHCRVGGC